MNNQITGRTVWDFLSGIFSNNRIFFSLIIGILIGLVVGISKIVDIKVIWENGAVRIRNIKPNIEGEWEIINRIQNSTYGQYENLTLIWRLYISQKGNEISGHAIKIVEDGEILEGNRKSRLNILSGKIEANKISIIYEENGNNGRFEWYYCKDLDIMKGTFSSSLALTKGSSIVIKLPNR